MSSEQASRPGSGPGRETECSLVTPLLTQPSGCSDRGFVGRFSEGLPVRVLRCSHGQHGPLCHRHVPSLPHSLLSRVLLRSPTVLLWLLYSSQARGCLWLGQRLKQTQPLAQSPARGEQWPAGTCTVSRAALPGSTAGSHWPQLLKPQLMGTSGQQTVFHPLQPCDWSQLGCSAHGLRGHRPKAPVPWLLQSVCSRVAASWHAERGGSEPRVCSRGCCASLSLSSLARWHRCDAWAESRNFREQWFHVSHCSLLVLITKKLVLRKIRLVLLVFHFICQMFCEKR